MNHREAVWKPHERARFVDVFGTMKSTSHAPELEFLLAKIGQPTLEHDCLEGVLIRRNVSCGITDSD